MRIRYSQASNRSRVKELRQLPPAPDERLLDGVLGEVRVAQDELADRVETVDLAGSQLPEGIPIAAPGSLQKVSPHARPPCSRRSFDRLLTL